MCSSFEEIDQASRTELDTVDVATLNDTNSLSDWRFVPIRAERTLPIQGKEVP
jgi:hypothetical protein